MPLPNCGRLLPGLCLGSTRQHLFGLHPRQGRDVGRTADEVQVLVKELESAPALELATAGPPGSTAADAEPGMLNSC